MGTIFLDDSIQVQTRFSFLERIRNDAFILGGRIFSRLGNSTDSRENRLQSYYNIVKSSPLLKFLRASAFKMVESFDVQNKNSASTEVPIKEFLETRLNAFRERVDKLKSEYGHEFFTNNGMLRASSTILGLEYLARVRGLSAKSIKALDAIALLHPITDDLFDRGELTPSSLKKITRALNGENESAENASERVILDLIGEIYKAYPPREHPKLFWAINALHHAQIESLKQQSQELSEEDILRLSFKKGGLSMVVASYIAQGSLSEAEMEFYFKQVGIFQLMDDFEDIGEDFKDGTKTIWTYSYLSDEHFERTLQRFVRLQRKFESDSNNVTSRFPGGQKIAGFLSTGLWTTLFLGLAEYSSLGSRRAVRNAVSGSMPFRYSTTTQLLRLATSQSVNLSRMGTAADTCRYMLESLRPQMPLPN